VSQETTNRYFDELASGLASGSISRGKALKLMGAALVGGTLASLGIGGVASADLCKRNGKVCKKDSQCCSGNCDDSNFCAEVPSHPFRCLCNDFSVQQACFPAECSSTGSRTACAQLCATHGGEGPPLGCISPAPC
jgi:hypothetical protein